MGWMYAIGYMNARYPRGGAVWQCRLTLPRDAVLDFTQPQHLKRLQARADPSYYDALVAYAQGGPLPWLPTEHTAQFEQVARQAGFDGVVLQERKGAQAILSVCVFDPGHIEIIGHMPKAEAMQRYGKLTVSGRGDATA